MERLTERFDNGQAAVMGCGENCKYDYKYCRNHYEECPEINKIYERLAEYEDTGLAPEKILELKERDDAKAPVQFGDEDEPMLRCPHCDENITDLIECGFNFCPYCGKRWYGE